MNTRFVGDKQYELSNHLGNVLSVVSDCKLFTDNYYTADVLSYSDYYPFGMIVPGKHGSSDSYRYGFNTQEKVDEISGKGNHNTAKFWEYDTRTGRRWNQDPKPNPSISNYAAFANNPILYTDHVGDTIKVSYHKGFLGLGGKNTLKYEKGNLFNSDGTAYTGKAKGYLGKVKEALNKINSVSSGQQLLNDLETSKFVFDIQKGKDNRFKADSQARASLGRVNPNFMHLAGSGGAVFWNPDKTTSGPNQLGNLERPNFIGLAHELSHGLMASKGITDLSFFAPNHIEPEFRKVTNDEFNAVHIENQLRSNFGLPLREFYSLDSSGSGFMRFLNPNTSTNSLNNYNYQQSNPLQVPYNGADSGK